jgi:DNA mismatch endonuclease (patch repair protein)
MQLETSARMRKVRRKHTGAELGLRKALFAKGLRYRLHVTLIKKPRRTADIVFQNVKVAIFIDGCFWHGCPSHGSMPKNNAQFWCEKIRNNKARDADTNERLTTLGWLVIRVWEHQDPINAAEMISAVVALRRKLPLS